MKFALDSIVLCPFLNTLPETTCNRVMNVMKSSKIWLSMDAQ